jgi:hypothetical protein
VTEPSDGAAIPELDDTGQVTPEVGDEGGSPGDVEVVVDRAPATGSEATETHRPARKDRTLIDRDEVGRRSP